MLTVRTQAERKIGAHKLSARRTLLLVMWPGLLPGTCPADLANSLLMGLEVSDGSTQKALPQGSSRSCTPAQENPRARSGAVRKRTVRLPREVTSELSPED